jgi:hypothetical protein
MLCTQYIVIALCLTIGAPLTAQPKYRQFDSPEIKFPYPDDWNFTVLSGQVQVAFVNNTERSFVITRTQPPFPPKFDEIYEKIEESSLRDVFPAAAQVVRTAITHPVHGTIVQIDFTLQKVPGRNARPLRLRQLSIPIGTYTYRVTCVAREDEFKSKYDIIFRHMVDKLVITPPAK